MNLFFLDRNLDTCAEYHIDRHVGKMQLEAAQLLTTTLWVDKYVGYVPEKLSSEQLQIIKSIKKNEPPIEQRQFTRYLPTHENHPCASWVSSSLEHFYWTVCYVNALNSECVWRGYKSHASCEVVNSMPMPTNIPDLGWTDPPLCMPVQFQGPDPIEAYRKFYIDDKASFASWKRRGQPAWWPNNNAPAQVRENTLDEDMETPPWE
jgi:hypothetical protein